MKLEELIGKYPRLYHMAHQGGWPSIRDNGIMSASALLDAYGLTGPARVALEAAHRPESVALVKAGLPGAVLRDQKPMRETTLANCLQDGLSPKDWYLLLNSKSFFWLSKNRIWRLLKAKAYRDLPQTVLTIDSAPLIAKYKKQLRLSPINSGSTLFDAQPRGKSTFMKIEDFPFAERKKSRPLENNVVELVVDYAVPDISDYVLAVHEVKGDKIIKELWRSAKASPNDHP